MTSQTSPAPAVGGRILFGAAYYDEYTPASAGPDRLTRDMEMMVFDEIEFLNRSNLLLSFY